MKMRLIDGDALYRQVAEWVKNVNRMVDEVKDRDEQQRLLTMSAHINSFMYYIFDAPTVNVDVVKHGIWIDVSDIDDHIYCSECGNSFSVIDNCTEDFDYCPKCGAKMEDSEEDELDSYWRNENGTDK